VQALRYTYSMLSSRARYATRALLDLSNQYPGQPTPIQEVAERQKIPLKYLQQIMLELKQAGIVHSRKGPGGGYTLAEPPEKLTLGSVLEAMDGPVVDLSCNITAKINECGCPDPNSCALRSAFSELAEAMRGVLNETNFGELRDRQREADLKRKQVIDFAI
jgi:Rrf2 family protein